MRKNIHTLYKDYEQVEIKSNFKYFGIIKFYNSSYKNNKLTTLLFAKNIYK